MSIATINPATGETVKTFEPLTDAQLEEKLKLSVRTFAEFRKTTFAERAVWMKRANFIAVALPLRAILMRSASSKQRWVYWGIEFV